MSGNMELKPPSDHLALISHRRSHQLTGSHHGLTTTVLTVSNSSSDCPSIRDNDKGGCEYPCERHFVCNCEQLDLRFACSPHQHQQIKTCYGHLRAMSRERLHIQRGSDLSRPKVFHRSLLIYRSSPNEIIYFVHKYIDS